MKGKSTTLVLLAVLLAAAGCQKTPDQTGAIASLENSIKVMEGKIGALEKRIAKISKDKASKELVHDVDADSVDETLAAFNEKLFEIEQILKSAGLDILSTNESVEASVVTELVEEKAMEIKREKYQTAMRATMDEQRRSDADNYGQAFTDLRNKTRPDFRRMREMSDEERQKKFGEMQAAREEILNKYPNSYAATQIMAENTVRKLFENKYQDALDSYRDMMASRNGSEVVNDFGTRTATGLQYSLARKAIQEEDYTTARQLISELEKSSDEMVMAFDGPGQNRGQGGQGGWGGQWGRGGRGGWNNSIVTKSQAISRLKDSMN